MTAITFSLKSTFDLRPCVDGGADCFETTGYDPQIFWSPNRATHKALRCVAGIRIAWKAELISGEFARPQVFANWGDGFVEASSADLAAREHGILEAYLPAAGPGCEGIRIDPSEMLCVFKNIRIEVHPVGQLNFPTPLSRLVESFKRGLGPVRGPLRRIRRRFAEGSKWAGVSVLTVWSARKDASRWRAVYEHAFNVARNTRSIYYAAPSLTAPVRTANSPKLIAFYLPQFHRIPENDRWWGKGFTEWTNVSKAVPQYVGHYQPRLPSDLGYYDLQSPGTIPSQIDLAKRHGVYGFCFHYYNFNGKRLLERPLDNFVADAGLKYPFALCWANENWTRRWDGQENEILISQQHSPRGDVDTFDDIACYMQDPRYIRIGSKPLVVIYRPDALPNAAETVRRWRQRAHETGLGELHILCTNAFGFANFRDSGFDGLVQFPPHGIRIGEVTDHIKPLNGTFSGKVYDYAKVSSAQVAELQTVHDNIIPGVMPGWDNEPRRPGAGNSFVGATPPLYYQWLKGAAAYSAAKTAGGGGVVFLNAWNEWAEGAYLEPDRWFGHGFLQATRLVMDDYAPKLDPQMASIVDSRARFRKTTSAVIVLHLYYPEMIDDFAKRTTGTGLDIILTVPDSWEPHNLIALQVALPQAMIVVVENRGRDLLPFLDVLNVVSELGYDRFCKLHSKKSPHLAHGDQWRDNLLEALVTPATIKVANLAFDSDPSLGLLAPSFSRTSLSDAEVIQNNVDGMSRLAATLNIGYTPKDLFPAGSMYWGRISAFRALLNVNPTSYQFEPEMGRIDGTTAHALERLIGAVVERAGYTILWIP